MNKFLIITALISMNSYADTIKGVVDSFDSSKNEVKFRTATKNFTVDFNKLDNATKTLITSKGGTSKIQDFTFPASAIKAQADAPMRADCSELPTSMDELRDVAKSSKDMLDFLTKIPEGTLQGFTFVTNTLSLHRGVKDKNGEGQVSAMWPRVLRSSADGKITVSFVCDPKNPTFGRVEIISFDDKDKEFKTTEFDFGHPTMRKVGPKDRIHENPVSCLSCHSGSEINNKVSLKPNWPEYFFWSDCKDDRGIKMYGSSDDNMGPGAYRDRFKVASKDTSGCDYTTDSAAVEKEKVQFQKFKEMQKNNACFNSLPWKNQENMKDNAKYYPYANVAQNPGDDGFQNYSTRTNARFTDTYSHLMADRLSSLIAKSPEYEQVKYYLAMEEAGCLNADDEKKIQDMLPGFTIDKTIKYRPQGSLAYSIEAERPLLYNYAKRMGLKNKDWTMEFREDKDPNYNAVMFYGLGLGDAKIHNVVGGNIMKNIAESNEALKPIVDQSISKGISEVFGPRFSCIDKLGGAIKPGDRSPGSPLCAQLRAENDKHLLTVDLKNVAVNCVERNPASEEENLAKEVEKSVQKFTQDQLDRGKKLVEVDGKGKCVMCHSASVDMLPKDFRFIPADKDAKKAESEAIIKSRKNELVGKIENRLIKTKTMPPIDNELTDSDRKDIQAYLLSLAFKK